MIRNNPVTGRDNNLESELDTLGFGVHPLIFWLRGPCEIEGDSICLPVDSAEVYPVSPEDILTTMSQMKFPLSEKAIRDFVSRFGLLRNGLIEMRSDKKLQIELHDGSFVTPYQDDYDAANQGRVLKEDIGLWSIYIGQLSETLETYYYVTQAQAGIPSAINRLRQKFRQGQLLHLSEKYDTHDRPVDEWQLIDAYTRLVAQSINIGMQLVSHRVIPRIDVAQVGTYVFADPLGFHRVPEGRELGMKRYDSRSLFLVTYTTRALIGAAWHALYNKVTSSETPKRCLECGAYFTGGRSDREFCPGEKCSSRFRQRKRREKTKAPS